MTSFPNVLVMANGKGGVGKTTLTANLGGLAAAHAKLRVLLVDLDPQGNLRRNLGTPRDDGSAMFKAIAAGHPLPVHHGVRERLDAVPGGPVVADLTAMSVGLQIRGGGGLHENLARSLAPVVGGYDLVIIDTPPGDRTLVEAAMRVGRSVVIPTEIDDASIDGLELTAERFAAARKDNPELVLLGVALFRVGTNATRMDPEARAIITGMLGDAAPVFATRIRYSAAAARDSRRLGLLVHELEGQAAEKDKAWYRKLRDKTADDIDLRSGGKTAKGLADDYWGLAAEVLKAMQRHRVGGAVR